MPRPARSGRPRAPLCRLPLGSFASSPRARLQAVRTEHRGFGPRRQPSYIARRWRRTPRPPPRPTDARPRSRQLAGGADAATGWAAARGLCACCWPSWVSCPSRRRSWSARLGREPGPRARPSESCTTRGSSRSTRWPCTSGLSPSSSTTCASTRNDAGAPLLTSERVRVRPRLFALLAGKLAIDQVELDVPRVRAVVRDGQLANLSLPRGESSASTAKWPERAPFNAFALTDASLDLDIEETKVDAQSVDLDVTAEDELGAEGTAFEIALRIGKAGVHRSRGTKTDDIAVDDDALCSVEGRVRVEPRQLLVRRLEGVGSADLDAAAGTAPPCDLPAEDKRRVEVSLWPPSRGPADGRSQATADRRPHARVRVPIALAERVAKLPETDGWIAIDTDIRYGSSDILPDLGGTVEAHDVRVSHFSFAQEFHSQFVLQQRTRDQGAPYFITLPEAHAANSRRACTITLDRHRRSSPWPRGVRLDHTCASTRAGVDFTTLLRNLGVHPHSWVGWDIREVHTATIAGTLMPLKLDGELTAKTFSFGVYDRPAEDKARERIFGINEAQVASHVAIRQDSLRAVRGRARCPAAVPRRRRVRFARLQQRSARGRTAHDGAISTTSPPSARWSCTGASRPRRTSAAPSTAPSRSGTSSPSRGWSSATSASATSAEATSRLDRQPGRRGRDHRRARQAARDSATTRSRRAPSASATASRSTPWAQSSGLRPARSCCRCSRSTRTHATTASTPSIATRADVHVALGGPEGRAAAPATSPVDAKGHLTDVHAYGEKFAQGDADVSVRWYDRLQGIAGADIDVRSFVLDKVPAADRDEGPPRRARSSARRPSDGAARWRPT